MCLFFRATTKKREALNITSSISDEVGQSKTKKTNLPSNYQEATKSPSLSLETQSFDKPHPTNDDMTISAQKSNIVSEDSMVS